MAEEQRRERRHWADVAVIVAGLALCGLAIWPPPFVNTQEVAGRLSVWQVYALAGGLTITGLLLGQRWQWRTVARGLLLAAVVVLVVGLIMTFRELGPAAILSMILPGLLILGATPFFGPMPRAAASSS